MRKIKELDKCRLDNLDFLKFDTEERAYVAGLLFADGYIDPKQTSLWCYLVKDDMLAIKDILCKVIPFNFYNRKLSGKRKEQIGANIYSSRLIEGLLKTDFKDKSRTFSFIGCKHSLKKYFLRGYFDGDGCFFIKKYGKTKNKKYYNMSFNVSSHYESDWSILEKFLSSLNIEYRIVRYKYKNSSFSRLVVSRKNSLVKLINFIYSDYDFIGLKRKYDKAMEINNVIFNKNIK